MEISEITTVSQLEQWIIDNMTSPKNPPLKGVELNEVLRKIIEFYPNVIIDNQTSETSTWSSEKIASEIESVATSLTFTQANLVEVYDRNYSLSFNLPEGKSIASIGTKAGTVTRYLSPSQAVKDTANDPNTIIEGFDNNAAQTITIKLI